MVAHAFNPSTWETEAGGFLSLRPAWSSRTARATQRNPVSKNNQTKTKTDKNQQHKISFPTICLASCSEDSVRATWEQQRTEGEGASEPQSTGAKPQKTRSQPAQIRPAYNTLHRASLPASPKKRPSFKQDSTNETQFKLNKNTFPPAHARRFRPKPPL